ncbi:hypothetical protein MUP56_02015 [Patescibacteria group bacterium]|nr:hypothetical protein [Patescibacteria group bacterium]
MSRRKKYAHADAAVKTAHVKKENALVPALVRIAPVIAIAVRKSKKQVRSFCRS